MLFLQWLGVCVRVVAVVIYSKASAWPFPDLFGHTVKIAQLGGHSITIVDAHLLQRFVCIQDGEINITFHATHCFFYALCPIARGPSRGREGGVAGVQFSPLKGYRHFEIRPGESQQDNETGQNSYCPIEINLNKKPGLSAACIPTARTAASKSASPSKRAAQQRIMRAFVRAFAPHYRNYGRVPFVIKHWCQIRRAGRQTGSLISPGAPCWRSSGTKASD